MVLEDAFDDLDALGPQLYTHQLIHVLNHVFDREVTFLFRLVLTNPL